MAAKIGTILMALTLLLIVACDGAPAAPEATVTSPAESTVATTGAEPTGAPTPTVAVAPQLTATPQMAPALEEVEVNPGKLTVMLGNLGDERFDAAFSTGEGSAAYGRIVGGYLISGNEKSEMMPGIASAWKLSADGLTWTFTIREGVMFHDGSDLRAEDVHWTLRHLFGPEAIGYAVGNTPVRLSRETDTIELSAPDQVSVTTKQPVTQLPILVSEVGPNWHHIMPQRSKVHDIEVETAYDNKPIGAGIMKLVGRTPAQVMNFERFDEYYYQPDNGFPEDKRVAFQSLDLYLVPEEATRVAALRAGDADIVPASLSTRKQVEAGGGRMVFGQEGVYVYVAFLGCWESQYPCQDKRVRQALEYAIDKELMRNQLYGPDVFEVKGWNYVTPSTIGYTPAMDPWPYDPDKARQLLAEAGYPDGEGFGELIVNTYPSSAMPFQVEGAQLAADFWRRELGLDVEVRVVDSAGLEKMETAGELNGQILWRENEARKDATSSIAAKYADPNAEDQDRVHNDPELFRLALPAFEILDPDERAKALEELFPKLKEESYWLSIGYANIPWGVGPRVETWEPYPLSAYPSALHTIILK
jgi:peptide/nickel transport system substrate-binding protein